MNNVHFINFDKLIETVEKVNCGEMVFVSNKYFEIRFSKIQPPENYSAPDKFPHCCGFHKDVFKAMESQYAKLPNCCEKHSKLNTTDWFVKENYKEVPLWTVQAIHYCETIIHQKIEADDWYEDISDYFEYVSFCFGQFPKGFGSPFGWGAFFRGLTFIINHHIRANTYTIEKLTRLLSALDKYTNSDTNADKADINILIGRYHEWIKIFPFEISYLSGLQEYFLNRIPVIKGEVSVNRYSKLSKSKIITYDELLDHLVKTTTTVLQTLNAYTLFQEGKLDEIAYKQLEVCNASRRLELSCLEPIKDKGKKQYIKVIKKWLKGEEAYLDKIAPILKQSLHHNIFIK